jgi:osmotically-inducible protein OsmY
MNAVTRSALSVALAAGTMYLLDPVSGRRRRLLLRDQCAQTAKRLELGTRDARHDLSSHVGDLAGKAKSHLGRKEMSDKAICKNVKQAIEHSVTQPKAISCAVRDGNVFLRGDILTYEHQQALDETRAVPGVRVVTDHLTPREPAEGVRPAHNGKSSDGWSIAGRVFVGATSCALLFWGVKERKALSAWGAETGQALWKRSKAEVEEKLEGMKDAFESGGEDAQAVAHEAAQTAADIGESILIRARARETESADPIRTHASH